MLSLLVAGAMQSAWVIPNPHVLVFSKTTGFRHDSIPSAIAALKKLGTDHGFQVDATEDSTVFTDDNLKKYDLICFASTTGTILDDSQKKAMERFVESGKGWMGIHSASDTEYDWPWYGKLVGAYFRTHPAGGQHVLVNIENRGNPSTNTLPRFWVRPDEWYEWRENPRGKVTVLASLDEGFYKPDPQDHPIAWCHWQGKGRSWYTEMGHYKEAYSEKWYLEHLYGGLMWAAQGSRRPVGAVDYSPKNQGYGDCFFHAEFKPTDIPQFISFGSKNQIFLLNSQATVWNKLSATDCGGTNGHPPLTNACAGRGYWNTIDAVMSASNHVIAEVRINGIIVQQNVDTLGQLGKISFSQVPGVFRNVWVKAK